LVYSIVDGRPTLRTSLGSFPSSEQIVAQLEAQAAAEASTSQATDVSVEDDGEEAVDLGDETEDDEDVCVSLLSRIILTKK
jgi:hypothetical protein